MTNDQGWEPDIAGLGRTSKSTKPDFYARDIIAAYNGLRAFESDFDKAQGLLRTVASAWLLAGIGAVGFVINTQFFSGKGPESLAGIGALLRQAILFLIALGTIALWRLDQRVYQNLLHNIFALGYWIEYRYPCVPPARMSLYHGNADITGTLSIFYKLPVGLFTGCALLNVLLAIAYPAGSGTDGQPVAMLVWTLFLFGLHAIVCLFTWTDSASWSRLSSMLPPAATNAGSARPHAPPRSPFTPVAIYEEPAGDKTAMTDAGAPVASTQREFVNPQPS